MSSLQYFPPMNIFRGNHSILEVNKIKGTLILKPTVFEISKSLINESLKTVMNIANCQKCTTFLKTLKQMSFLDIRSYPLGEVSLNHKTFSSSASNYNNWNYQ